MRAQPQSSHSQSDPQALDLLQQLIETPPTDQQPWHTPVVLRSADEQRAHALRGYLFRNWFDGLLQHTERLLFCAVLVVFGYWVYDGPVRDWLYLHSAPPATIARAAQAPAAELRDTHKALAPTVERAPLPFTTPDMAAPIDDGFIAPRSVAGDAKVSEALQPERLQIPALALDTSVKEVFVRDGVWEVADYAAGYMHGSALPGEKGTMALAGHAGMRGGVFRSLGDLQPRDDILVDAAGWRYRYRVRESFSVRPTQTEVLAPATTPVLVLITCTNWDTERLIVMADLIESKPIPKN